MLYAGQTESDVLPLESEAGKLLFNEDARRDANRTIESGILNPQLHDLLVEMYQDGSHQAAYFLGRFISEGIIEYPAMDKRGRGEAGPGYTGTLELGPYAFKSDKHSTLNQTLGDLRDRGVNDPYGAIEQE